MFRRSAPFTLMILAVISFILRCDLPNNPSDPVNSRVELLIRNTLWSQSNVSITDSVGNPVQIGLAINLPVNVDSIKLSVKAEGIALFDTVYKTFSNRDKDTLWKIISFSDTGYKLVSIIPYAHAVNLVPVSAGITIVKKNSTIQPDKHAPKWTEKTLNVALNDTTRYELNLSPLCSDPDKDILHYAISGKPLPGDTIIDSLYVFLASSATIGKNSVELIASDPSGLKDTMELVLNVTASGTDNNKPEVTIIAPDRDSSVTNSENYVVDLLCSDASGIDSVYAVFNGKITSAVLENGHYKINITGLIAGVYNVIELTVRDKSVNALKTTITIKIKYAQSFTISYSGNGSSSGTVPTDTGKYETGTTATVKGNTGNLVKTGYVFVGWNTAADGSGTAYADGSSLIMGTKDVTLFARWTQNATFTVTYDGNTSSTGTAPSDAGKYETGTSVTVKENTGSLAKTGFTFAGWNTAADGTGTAYAAGSTFKMGTGDVTLFARWTQNATYTVTYDGNTNSTGAVPIDLGKYENGAMVTVKSNSGNLVKTGFTFVGWATSASGTDVYKGEETFKIGTNDVTLYAIWKQNTTYALTITSTNGQVTISPSATVFDSGTIVTLTPVPSPNYHFSGWIGALSGTTNPATITMNSAKSVTAIFEANPPNTFALTVLAPNGTVQKTPDQTQYDSGFVVTLTAVPNAGYQFTGWSGGITGTTNPSSVTMNAAKNITANFVIKTFALSVDATNGSVTKLPDVGSFDSGTVVTLTAVPDAGYQFTGWSGGLTGTTNPSSVTMNAAKSVTANFAIKTYALSVTATNGTVSKSPNANTYDSGTVVTLTAVPAAGYQFTGWSGGLTGTTNPSSVTMSAAKSVTANFALKTFALSISAANGTVTKSPNATTFDSGTVVTLTAVPGAGYQFEGWGGELTGTTNPTSVKMEKDRSVVAKFSLITYSLTYDGNGNSGGSVPISVSGIVSGASVTVSAAGSLVRTGYEFLGWNFDPLATTAQYNSSQSTIVITANTTLYAIWKLLPTYTVTYNANGGGVESAHGAGLVPTDSKVYTTNTIVTVLDNPGNLKRIGYVFYGWTKVANDTTTLSSFMMGSANVILYARWVIMDASGNEYTEVKIGDQVWMVENLRTTKYRDGTPILYDTSSATWISGEVGKYCFYNNTTNIDTIRKFGALYNGYAVDTKNLTPQGWHVPDSNEVAQLQNYLILNGYNADGKRAGNTVAKSLASKTDWVEDTTTYSIGRNLNENNKTGFSAYPAGGRIDVFAAMGIECILWTTTKNPENNLIGMWFDLTNTSAELRIGRWFRSAGLSVRAVRDW